MWPLSWRKQTLLSWKAQASQQASSGEAQSERGRWEAERCEQRFEQTSPQCRRPTSVEEAGLSGQLCRWRRVYTSYHLRKRNKMQASPAGDSVVEVEWR